MNLIDQIQSLSVFSSSILGGLLIGLAASIVLWTNGKIMGISGIVCGMFRPKTWKEIYRITFIVGFFTGSIVLLKLKIPFGALEAEKRSLSLMIISGLLVGVGTTLSHGCTSGHAICGISRFSPRSILATILFVLVGILTATLFHFL